MCTTEHYHLQAKLLKVFQKFKQNMMESAKLCAKGKNTKKTFPSSESKAKGILEIIHSDVCGPMSSSSLSGYVYYVSFIDDFSRKTWIYFMKNKDEVFNKFKEFKALIENHTEKKTRPFNQTVVENSLQMNSKSYAKTHGLRGSCPLLTIHNRMGL